MFTFSSTAMRNKENRNMNAKDKDHGRKNYIFLLNLFVLLSFLPFGEVYAQYFGKNKPNYETFDFRVFRTPHFEIYHYMENDSAIKEMAEIAEQWYYMHQEVFKDTFDKPNPIILYSNHADFQQTNAIMGQVGVGTGGVTEAMKNRVVLPFFESRAKTIHVIGHELIHAFQFKNMFDVSERDTAYPKSITNLPLWMVEGMSEYMSIGSIDPHTAMWMRDAVLIDDFPALEDLYNYQEYFPYRYGQAFWVFVTKMWGDDVILPLFEYTARYGYRAAIDSVLGISAKQLGNMWKSATYVHYKKYMEDTTRQPVGKMLLYEKTAGRLNIAPSLSPDGSEIAFLSQKNIFSIELFLADSETGKIKKRLASTLSTQRIDAIDYIESAATWSPDGSQIAYVVFQKGSNALVLIDVDKGNIKKTIKFDELPSFSEPVWSPDGKIIALTGLKDGISDIYTYDIESGELNNLTNDWYTNIQADWSPDGKKMIFVTDKVAYDANNRVVKANYNLALYDLETAKTDLIEVFPGVDNLNPEFSSDGKSIYFLSSPDGFRNLYRYSLEDNKVFKLTDLLTGISGITEIAPALSVAKENNKMAYIYYNNKKYTIYTANKNDFEEVEVEPGSIDLAAATLPPLQRFEENIVDENLAMKKEFEKIKEDTFRYVPFQRKFKLDYIGNSGVGVATSRFGTGLAGSVDMLFSDILGEYMLFASLGLNGQVYDFGGQAAFMNRRHRLSWGGSVSHIPYRYGFLTQEMDTLDIQGEEAPVIKQSLNIQRMFEDKIAVFSYYPISHTRRIEAGFSHAWYYFRLDKFNYYYDASQGFFIGSEQEKNVESDFLPDGFNLQQVDLAYVTDNSSFGMTSPLRGHRSRIQAMKYFGEIKNYTLLLDYRKYLYLKPVSLAFRSYHLGRYGEDSRNELMSPLFLGYPWYIRGYDAGTFSSRTGSGSNVVTNLTGTKMSITNFEIRLPFSGIEQLALIESKYFLTQLVLFFDAGLASTDDWNVGFKSDISSINTPGENQQPAYTEIQHYPVFSAGLSLRVNVFGALILEPFYAIPFQRDDVNFGVLGLNFLPGW